MNRGTRPETIAKILRNVGHLEPVGPKKRIGARCMPIDVKTMTEVAKATCINQSRLRPIMRDLSDSQLIDAFLQGTTFRKPIKDYPRIHGQPEPEYSTLRSEVPRPPKLKIPKGLGPSEVVALRIRDSIVNVPVPQRDIYLRFYRTELGDEWLRHYNKFPNSTKRLHQIRERYRLSKLPKNPWEQFLREAVGLEPKSTSPK